MGACASQEQDPEDPVASKRHGSSQSTGESQKQTKEPPPQPTSPQATRQSTKVCRCPNSTLTASKTACRSWSNSRCVPAQKPADPAWHGKLDVEPAGVDDRQAEYDTLFANKGKMLKTSENGGWTIKQYETGIQTQEQEGTMMVAFKDGTQYQLSQGQLVHTYKVRLSQWSRHLHALSQIAKCGRR